MSKPTNIVTIDFNTWTTQAEYARSKGVKPGTVNQWVARVKEGTDKPRVTIFDIPQLNLTLVAK